MVRNLKTLILIVTIISAISGFFFGLLGSHIGNQINSEENVLVNNENKSLGNMTEKNSGNKSLPLDTCSIDTDFSCS
ncbi:MAG: hypothetical protein KC589_03010 [Nanoarchaeota archaeon]|nr:hypothetical protein [Nanoarchaeota archaeon]